MTEMMCLVREAVFLDANGLSIYDGEVYHGTPLLVLVGKYIVTIDVSLFFFALDILTGLCLFQVVKQYVDQNKGNYWREYQMMASDTVGYAAEQTKQPKEKALFQRNALNKRDIRNALYPTVQVEGSGKGVLLREEAPTGFSSLMNTSLLSYDHLPTTILGLYLLNPLTLFSSAIGNTAALSHLCLSCSLMFAMSEKVYATFVAMLIYAVLLHLDVYFIIPFFPLFVLQYKQKGRWVALLSLSVMLMSWTLILVGVALQMEHSLEDTTLFSKTFFFNTYLRMTTIPDLSPNVVCLSFKCLLTPVHDVL